MSKIFATGNEYISLPRIDAATAAIEDVTFLHMGYKGLVDIGGSDTVPFLRPFINANGADHGLEDVQWTRLCHWLPQFTAKAGGIQVEGTLFAPMGERGFVYRLVLQNTTPEKLPICAGFSGAWGETLHSVNEDKPIEASRHFYTSTWSELPVFDMRLGTPMFAFSPMADVPMEGKAKQEGETITYSFAHKTELLPGESATITLFWGLGFEEVAAATSAQEMKRQTYETELAATLEWLRARQYPIKDTHLNELYNHNLFFCLLFSAGRTLDTEELVLVTSRSPRYYVSAAYWDRDSLLWAFPTVLDADPMLAREMLDYVFGRQRRNFGVHSRYIDGTVLEPGFELDELMAPVIALESYVDKTGDKTVLDDADVQKGVKDILRKLAGRKAPAAALYSTFLQPTDDEIVYPYITYNNVLVARALAAIDRLYGPAMPLAVTAEEVKQAIWDNCVMEKDGQKYFAWSVDLEGRHDVYDEPPGSLQLLPYYGFCAGDDPVWKRTVEMIRSADYEYSFAGQPIAEIGCPHAPFPWVLSIGNSLLSGHEEQAFVHLGRTDMDNGVACESVDPVTGESRTGDAFATCAGFLCHAIRTAVEGGA